MNATNEENSNDAGGGKEDTGEVVLAQDDNEEMKGVGRRTTPPPREAVAATGSRVRLRWPPITVVTITEGENELKATYPFLKPGNYMDLMLVRQVMVDEPYAAPFGKTGQAWKMCAKLLSKAPDPQGNLV